MASYAVYVISFDFRGNTAGISENAICNLVVESGSYKPRGNALYLEGQFPSQKRLTEVVIRAVERTRLEFDKLDKGIVPESLADAVTREHLRLYVLNGSGEKKDITPFPSIEHQ